ncbi:hypothetical protein V6R21_03390 [Limibacter armeniacum]|uniref:hypothetical protein n=1 Tax=Limibacter armeniacum TaxID=466084 RepID=UPI002FE5CC9C
MLKAATPYTLHQFDVEHQILYTSALRDTAPFVATDYFKELDTVHMCLMKYNPRYWLVDFRLQLVYFSPLEVTKHTPRWKLILQDTVLERVAIIADNNNNDSVNYANQVVLELSHLNDSLPIDIQYGRFILKQDAMKWLLG